MVLRVLVFLSFLSSSHFNKMDFGGNVKNTNIHTYRKTYEYIQNRYKSSRSAFNGYQNVKIYRISQLVSYYDYNNFFTLYARKVKGNDSRDRLTYFVIFTFHFWSFFWQQSEVKFTYLLIKILGIYTPFSSVWSHEISIYLW